MRGARGTRAGVLRHHLLDRLLPLALARRLPRFPLAQQLGADALRYGDRLPAVRTAGPCTGSRRTRRAAGQGRRVGRHAEAVESALLADSSEPLRESAQRALIEAHLAEGNLIEAMRAYDTYRALVKREPGVEPGCELSGLIRNFCRSATRTREVAAARVRRA
ncbi:bacterial transcriptional activator domain-containing protein [Streptomyces sp. 2132.2]|uniref:bacterial transcriptional activator domain-containing protein n=1 Tax=Streptomyces sp. 2132.2 TaxID=2485161 RepID=UPI00288B0E08|nr:bacterial transcriptional activator domain-containing protein [Streptomyces sp. 2132.2]